MAGRVVTSPPLVEQVYEAIIDDICTGVIKGGEQLRQEAIAERLGVSRHPVQQAMVLLKRHGLVQESGRRGLEVVPMDADFVEHLYDMRLLLDVHAVRHTTPRFTDERHRDEISELIARGKEAVRQRSFSDMVTADADFHSYFYGLTENPFLIDTAELLSQSIRRVMTEVLARGGVPAWVWQDHEQIMTDVLNGNAEAAADHAYRHVQHGRKMMLENLAEI